MYQDKQPQPMMGMTVAPGGNRNIRNLPYNSSGKRGWSHSICGCCGSCGTCCCAWFCPCVVYSKVKKRVDHLNAYGRADPHNGGGCCTGDCMLWCCLQSCLGAGFVLQISNRGNIRGRYNISGGCCSDCCASFCCTPCALVQESRELELEERTLGR